MQFLFLLSGFVSIFMSDLFVESVAEQSANLYYGGLSEFFWGVPSKSAEEMAQLAMIGTEIEYLQKICATPFF